MKKKECEQLTCSQVAEAMPPEEELTDLADFFRVFGDVTRIRILYALLCKEMCVQEIADTLGMSQSAISHQLRVLKQLDLVKRRRDGKTIYYSPADTHIITILNTGIEHIEE
ncbi:MAG: metalloregulator ArsR/SmtB family transcription factor [Lachnospiraceae bacterium]|nr:metalloregulator ArsR/SmtB family transcription factor [Lachnospiraceae bacterium]